MSETALIVEVPEADAVVGALRRRYDPGAALGVPAHVTVLSPFLSVERITPNIVVSVEKALRVVTPFSYALEPAEPWPTVAFLRATPSDPFNAMTRAVARAFPAYPPYSGAHADLVPHLTFANGTTSELHDANAELRSIFERLGPLQSRCSAVTWIENSSGRWKQYRTISLSL